MAKGATTRSTFPSILVMVVLCLATPAWAGGFWLYEAATPDVGLASAGRYASALDAGTVLANPAGMTRLKGRQFLAGFQTVVPRIEFDVDESGFGGGNGGDAGETALVPALYYSHSVTEDFKLGLALGSYFGAGIDYDDDWAGRYYVEETSLLTAGVFPGAAYRLTDWLSVGGTVNLMVAELDQKTAVNNQITDPGTPDGQMKGDDTDTAVGGTIGVLLEPTPRTRFGVVYVSKLDLNFKDVVKFRNLGPNLEAILQATGALDTKVDMDMSVPQQVMLSGYHELTDRIAIMGNVGWQDWSDFGEVQISLRSQTTTDLTLDRDFDDVWHVALGSRWNFAERWFWSVGAAYDTSPVRNRNRTPDMPLDRQMRLATGLEYNLSDRIRLGLAYTYADMGKAKIRQEGSPLQGPLAGDYDTNEMHVVSLSLDWRF